MSLFPNIQPIKKYAVISECGLYRQTLIRQWSDRPLLPFVLLNPSKADANVGDPTLGRGIEFARREDMGGVWFENVFDLRATDPRELISHPARASLANEFALCRMIDYAVRHDVPIVCAWGNNSLAARESWFFVMRAKSCGARLVCLGKNKNGSPRHPLYIKGDQPLVPYP